MAAKLSKHLQMVGGPHAAGIYSDMTVDGEEIGTLVVVVDRAKNLPNRKSMGKQDPYCAARLGKEAKKTETDIRGGQTPRWDQELRYTVHDSPDYHNLKVSVFNDDKRTDLIGETWVSLEHVVVPGGGKGDKWHTLNCKGKYAGEIRIELTYYDIRESSEKQISEAAQATSRHGSGSGMAGPRQQPAVKRRPLPPDPANSSSPASLPNAGPPIPQPSFGPRSYHTPPHQRPLPASNSPSGFTIRDQASALPATSHASVYQGSEITTGYGIPSDQRTVYEGDMPEAGGSVYDDSQFPETNVDDMRSIHPSEQGWSGSADWPQQHQRHDYHGHRGPPLPHSHSAPTGTFPQEAHNERRLSYGGAPMEQDYIHDVKSEWSNPGEQYDHSRSTRHMQPMVEDEQPAPPPPPPAHRNSAPALPTHRSTPNLNSSTDMRAYAAQRQRMSIAENSPASSPAAQSPYGGQSPAYRGSPHGYTPQGSSFSTPSRVSREMVARSQAPSPIAYQRPQYSEPDTPPPTHSYVRQSTPLIKPQPISPTIQPSPADIPPPLRTSRSIISIHSTPTRKSVSPHPTPPRNPSSQSNSTPFSPDSFDAFNPSLSNPQPQSQSYSHPHSQSQSQSHAQSHSPLSIHSTHSSTSHQPSPQPRRQSYNPIDKHPNGIITPAGRIVDPSDHLPTESWAPEPERKGAKAASEIGAEERAGRPSPRGAQPMITARTKVGKGVGVTVNRVGYSGATVVGGGEGGVGMSSGAGVGGNSVVGGHGGVSPSGGGGAIAANNAGGGGGRNRLMKKNRPLSIGAPDVGNRGGGGGYGYAGREAQQQYEEFGDGYRGYGNGYGSGGGGGAYENYNSGYGGPPPVPAKIPIEAGPGAGGYTDPEMLALSEEMKSIDIGPTGMGTRSGRGRRGRFGF
ncbi:MAG: hypothetical protein M1820_004413 [Bogoriella megaspora]|nr:MAG: hypothetical protein M1820_004413 [Bogoriella megaspora]